MNGWTPILTGIALLALTFTFARIPLRYWVVGVEGERYKRTVRAFSLPVFAFIGVVCLLGGIAKLAGWHHP